MNKPLSFQNGQTVTFFLASLKQILPIKKLSQCLKPMKESLPKAL